ncbi:ABC-F family ATP-binding cassette domain-containing protein [Rhodococcus sp. HNM0569]|uniref:ABC-F family ATP-binding cassette domain-containing protein n=1 Tax=Rhodococcus sp. HNM0569 TaxID=2716340 RepID=UPI00146B5A7F|nr:ABC-F family ATP-binding cassette domain-containing protein [Rhodococcus sp. HNM0569]NLU84933.1 ABC-F family ATP-binding cassette domain-containing protein [Rhodococcus sp. HNM0569]
MSHPKYTAHPDSTAITFADAGFHWPDGSTVLAHVSTTFEKGRIGVVGDNGAGKSTLLRLIAGLLTPTSGHIATTGDVGYLPQTLTLRAGDTVADLLGVAEVLAALRAIEAGSVDEAHFEAVGDDWDIEARAHEALTRIGVDAGLDRRVAELSGGEAMLVAISSLRLRGTSITLLDEPTNNLDRPTRAALADLVDQWPGTLVVVSHDTELLEHMDQTAELHAGTLTVFGGPYSAWRAYLGEEQAAAAQAARAAEQALKVEKRQRIEAETKLARRERTGDKSRQNRRGSRISMGLRAQAAQVSAGALRSGADAKVQAAQSALDDAEARVRGDEHIRLTLPDPDVPRGRTLADLVGTDRTFTVQGPERVAIVGPNGVGKSSLLESLLAGAPAQPGRAHGVLRTDRVGYLPQRLDGLDDDADAVDNIRSAAPAAAPGEIRGRLAQLLLRGDSVHRPVRTLSGGERFRVSLARLLFAEPPAQLLVLDEPTNNLDLRSVDQLVDALAGYRGALLVVSHDHAFLARLGIDTVLALDADGRLSVTDL